MKVSKVSLSLEQLKKQANGLLVNVLDELCEEAVMHNRYVTWINSTLEYETVHSGLMGLDLYNGVAGVGLLFLYAGVLLKREDYLQIYQSPLKKRNLLN